MIFLQPSADNIKALKHELSTPKFGKYYIFFTNTVSRADLKILAESDRNELVEQVQQFYCDFLPLSSELWSVLSTSKLLETTRSFTSSGLTRTRDSLTAYFSSLNKSCNSIRYDSSSQICNDLASDLSKFITRQGDSESSSTLELIILDRRFDAITPLLLQWTYRAMLHEILTIQQGQIDLSSNPSIDPELQKVNLDPLHDEFYEKNMLLNFGEVSQNAQELIQKFQAEKQQQSKIDSIADMKLFLERFPAFKKLQNVFHETITIFLKLDSFL